MTNYELLTFPDGFLRRVIFGIGPYIADYPEQALLAAILSGWCPRLVNHSASLCRISVYQMFSCLSLPSDLDAKSSWRNRKHTDLLVDIFDQKYLAEHYGVLKDIIVSH